MWRRRRPAARGEVGVGVQSQAAPELRAKERVEVGSHALRQGGRQTGQNLWMHFVEEGFKHGTCKKRRLFVAGQEEV